jgi:hypothetical protein
VRWDGTNGRLIQDSSILITDGGNLLLGNFADGTGKLQFPAATTSAGGLSFGAGEFFLFRAGTRLLSLDAPGGGCAMDFNNNGSRYLLLTNNGADSLVSATTGKLILKSGNADALTLDGSQTAKFQAGILFSNYNAQTGATYTIVATDTAVSLNHSGGTVITLGTATNGRTLMLRTISADAVTSASSNVVPLAGGAAGTAILAATAGKWAVLQGDGTNWQVIAGN